jgi:hypothetical protein
LWDAIGLRVRWDLGESIDSRTRAHVPAPVAFQRGPLVRWRAPLVRRLPGLPVPVRRAGRPEGERLLDAAQAAVLVRYREVHAFNRADPGDVLVADAGRGARIAWFGLQPAHRLPLRAHYGYLLLKNGVPVGYGDASLFLERVEVAFNVFETFRQGESAFLLVRLCAFLFQRFGARVFGLSPYQLGHANEEALASGAFWFYHRLGFRPTRPDLATLAAAERRRIRREPGHRSSHATLARLAEGGMALAVGGHDRAAAGVDPRALALAAVGPAGRAPAGQVARALGAARWRRWPVAERQAFARWAAVLARIPALEGWPARDRRALVALIRAKGREPEAGYLRGLRRHRRLRRALVALAAAPRPAGRRP